ncbi:MAG: hypothetical protein AB7D47_04360 [Desulfovibrio sp.]
MEIVRGVKGICNVLKIGKRAALQLIEFDQEQQLGCITQDEYRCLRADVSELWQLYKLWCDQHSEED